MLSKPRFFLRRFFNGTNFWKENRLILGEIKHFRLSLICAILFSFTAAVFSGATIGLIGIFIQGLANPAEPPIQSGFSWFDVNVLATQAAPSYRIYRLSALILIVIWLQSSFTALGEYYSRKSSIQLTDRLKKAIVNQLQSLSLRFYLKSKSSDLINSIHLETNQIQIALDACSLLIANFSVILIYFSLMLLLSWQLTIVALLAFSLLSVAVSSISAKVREYSFDLPKTNKAFAGVALEFINGIRTVHSSVTQEYEQKRLYRAADNLAKARLKVAKLIVTINPLSKGIASTVLIIMVAVAFNLFVQTGQMKSALLLTFVLTLSRTTPAITQLNSAITKFNGVRGSFSNISKLLHKDDKPYLINGDRPFMELEKSIDFVSVNFGYEPDEPILHDITLSFRKGQTTALIGASGAGKTTLADLIPRFFDPSQGEILLDGINIQNFDIHTFRRKVAIVSQDTFIFNTTVRENIAYGVVNASEDEILTVAEQANALDFIMDLPQGLETPLGDRGVRLSGGQRQRIAIARALLRNPEILILDEATSALDSVTERLIQDALDKLTDGRTVIAIAHRLSTIAGADKVVVLDHGRIVEQGNYQELLERKGKLWQYHQMQYEFNQTA